MEFGISSDKTILVTRVV